MGIDRLIRCIGGNRYYFLTLAAVLRYRVCKLE